MPEIDQTTSHPTQPPNQRRDGAGPRTLIITHSRPSAPQKAQNEPYPRRLGRRRHPFCHPTLRCVQRRPTTHQLRRQHTIQAHRPRYPLSRRPFAERQKRVYPASQFYGKGDRYLQGTYYHGACPTTPSLIRSLVRSTKQATSPPSPTSPTTNALYSRTSSPFVMPSTLRASVPFFKPSQAVVHSRARLKTCPSIHTPVVVTFSITTT